MAEIERYNGETDLQYHKRLIYGKLVDKTLADMDYSELAEMIYGKAYSSDVARRMLYGSKYTLQLMEEEAYSELANDAIMSEIDNKMADLKKEQQRYYDQRREYFKLLRDDSRADHLYQIIADAAARVPEEIGVLYPCGTSYGESENEAVLVFADWHYGMTTDNVFNVYNTEICRQRVRKVVEGAIDRITLHECNTVHIVVLGDLFHGACHTSARVASEELTCEQIIHSSEILAQSIYEVSKYTENTYVYMTYGNHARVVQNKKDSIHRDNLEKIVNWWLIERFKDNPNIKIAPVPDNEFILMTVCGHDFCASHGDLDTVAKSPRLLPTLFQKIYGYDIEYILLADKHHRESYSELGVTSMICGALCGTDDYANDKRLYSDPSQLLLIVNELNGVDAEYRLRCS